MKTLLINGSPRPCGNTAALIRELKSHLHVGTSSKSLLSIPGSPPASTAVAAGKPLAVWSVTEWISFTEMILTMW